MPPGEDVLILLFATDKNIGLNNLEKTLKNHNFRYEIIGLGTKWINFSTMMNGMVKKLETLHPSQLVCIVDAYDVFANGDARELIAKFKSFGGRIVTGAEHYRTLFPPSVNYYKYYNIDETKLNYPYINTGLVMGYAKDLIHHFQWSIDNGHTDDQVAMIKYADEFPEKVAVDYHQKIMMNVLGLYPKKIVDGRMYNYKEKEYPVFVHVPGAPYDLFWRMDDVGKTLLKEHYESYTFKERVEYLFRTLYKFSGMIWIMAALLIVLAFAVAWYFR